MEAPVIVCDACPAIYSANTLFARWLTRQLSRPVHLGSALMYSLYDSMLPSLGTQ